MHLLEWQVPFIFQNHLLLIFWGDIILTTAYLISRYPLQLYRKSVYEVLFGSKPNYSHLCMLGYLCYDHNIHHTHKFDSWSVNAFLLDTHMVKRLIIYTFWKVASFLLVAISNFKSRFFLSRTNPTHLTRPRHTSTRF